MRSRILIVDDVLTQAIQLKVTLATSLYDVDIVESLAAARLKIANQPFLLVLVSERIGPIGDLTLFCEEVSSRRNAPPVMVIGAEGRQAEGGPYARVTALRALAAGAQEYLSLPMDEAPMMARIRSLARQGMTRWENWPGEGEGSSGAGQVPVVALVSPLPSEAVAWRVLLDEALPYPVRAMRTADLQAALRRRDLPIAIILAAPEGQMADLRLLAELKARPDTAEIPTLILGGATGDFAVLALDLGAQDVLPLTFDPAELALRLRLRLAQREAQMQQKRETREKLRLASVDALTGLANRRATMQRLAELQEEYSRGAPGYALLLLDVDRFKEVNDRFGHAAGDAVLTLVGQRISAALRADDLLGRIGGEEFLVALEGASLSEACRIAERLCLQVSSAPCRVPGAEKIEITISIGLCQPEPFESVEEILARADRALYAAKSLGRNTVEVDG